MTKTLPPQLTRQMNGKIGLYNIQLMAANIFGFVFNSHDGEAFPLHLDCIFLITFKNTHSCLQFKNNILTRRIFFKLRIIERHLNFTV